MADPITSDPDDRGTLDIRTKALERLVIGAALQVPGSVSRPAGLQQGGLQQLAARSLPSATVTFRGTTAVADLHVAATWPCRAEQLAADVREAARVEASRLSGADLGRVDVTLHVVAADTATSSTSGRRRVL